MSIANRFKDLFRETKLDKDLRQSGIRTYPTSEAAKKGNSIAKSMRAEGKSQVEINKAVRNLQNPQGFTEKLSREAGAVSGAAGRFASRFAPMAGGIAAGMLIPNKTADDDVPTIFDINSDTIKRAEKKGEVDGPDKYKGRKKTMLAATFKEKKDRE